VDDRQHHAVGEADDHEGEGGVGDSPPQHDYQPDRQRHEDQQPGDDAAFRDDAQVVERHADRGERCE
jgi:hypothetical protein